MEKALMEFASHLPTKQEGQVFVIEVKVIGKIYYLSDLKLTLSPNSQDSLVLLNAKTAHAVERASEKLLEEALQIPVVCSTIAILKEGVL